jgi:DNA-binding CsgD family transcriptional regulator
MKYIEKRYFANLQEQLKNHSSERITIDPLSKTHLPGYYGYTHNLVEGDFENVWGCEEVLGYPNNEFTLKLYYTKIHPDHRNFIFNQTKQTLDYLNSLDNLKPFDFTFTILFKIKKYDNTYAHILRTSTILECINNKITKTVSWCNNVTLMKLNNNMGVQGYLKGKPRNENMNILYSEKNKLYRQFTKRELEILDFTKIGLSTKEIAREINISEYTVSKHKSNILSKTSCKSLTEVLYNFDLFQ